MCGIAGLAGGFQPDLAARMNAMQRHRGPDGEGIFEDPQAGVSLGHVRLAILDLTAAAAQPMHSRDDRFVLVHNGEIYNYRELREDLESRGHAFRSTGDTEVLLYGLAAHGAAFIEKLNGIFAFALWDRRDRQLLLARDAAGVKPLYYAEPRPGELLFASEIKALFAHPSLKREPDFVALQQHLARGHASGNRTAFQGIRRLPPGSLLVWRADSRVYKIKGYWRPLFTPPFSSSYDEGTSRLRTALESGTRCQLVSDVPVGVFLSGGLDSSVIAALASRAADRQIQSFTITYPAEENRLDQFENDAPWAREMAAKTGLKHVEIAIKPEVAHLLPKLLWHMDEPLCDPALIACYLISKLARENGTPVLLSGQGGDELFGGYPRYPAMSYTRWLDGLPLCCRRGISKSAALLPGAMEGKMGGQLRRLRRVLQSAIDDSATRFLAYCSATRDADIQPVLSAEVRRGLGTSTSADECLETIRASGLNGMESFLHRDLTVYLPNHNLNYTDKMGMAVGLEARVPLLDQALLNLVPSMPSAWKVRGAATKRILRDAARGLVPDGIINRPKAGFGAPYRKWMRYDLAEMWSDLTTVDAVRQRGWFDPTGLQRVREVSQSGRQDLYMLQWSVLTVELWAREFLDRSPIGDRA